MKKVIIAGLLFLIIAGAGILIYDRFFEPDGEVPQPTPEPKLTYIWPPPPGKIASVDFTVQAWKYWDEKIYEGVLAYANKCIELYEEDAIFQQSELKGFSPREIVNEYWALNDVATCYFIKGMVYQKQGEKEKAVEIYQAIIDKFSYAQCYDPSYDDYWKVAEGADDKIIEITKGEEYKMPGTSWEMAKKAWVFLAKKDYFGVGLFTNKCIRLFEEEALKQQASLSDFPDIEADEDGDGTPDVYEKYWALNDVATCHFILGKALAEQGNQKESKKHFEKIIDSLFYAQCYDPPPHDWFWKVAKGAKTELERPSLPYPIGSDTSMELTGFAWGALGRKEYPAVEFYTRRCVHKYSDEADKQQAGLTDYPDTKADENGNGILDVHEKYWALNDVGTCYFILGEAYMQQRMWGKAREPLKTLMDKYQYAQCWDPPPHGWFWKPAVGARGRLNKAEMELKIREEVAKEKEGKETESERETEREIKTQ